MEFPRATHTATLLLDGEVLAAGGYSNGSILKSSELHDPVTNHWTATGDMSGKRTQQTATLLSDLRVLVVGGADGSATLPVRSSTMRPVAPGCLRAARSSR